MFVVLPNLYIKDIIDSLGKAMYIRMDGIPEIFREEIRISGFLSF